MTGNVFNPFVMNEKTKITVSGIYPKLTKEKAIPHLKKSLHQFDQGELSSSDLELVIQKNIAQAIEEMRQSGVSVFNDSLMRWTDFLSPFSGNFQGLKPGTLKRVFDTNTLQRKPQVTGQIKWRENFASSDLKYAKSLLREGEKIKATIPGPFTFFDVMENSHYQDEEEMMNDLAKALNQQILDYEQKGADYLEIYDPLLTFAAQDNVSGIYKIFLSEVHIPIIMGGFYGTIREENLEPITDKISGFTIDAITKYEWPKFDASIIQAALFDARTTALDDLSASQQKLAKIKTDFPQSEILVTLNNSLEFLPREDSQKKIARLGEII